MHRSLYSGELTSSPSAMSIDSRDRRGSQCPSVCTSAAGYSTASSKQRRFSSRHVPGVAEELARQSPALTPDVLTRFEGLMRHLKRNSDWDEHQKQVMVSDMQAFVPEDYDEIVRGEFERRCAFGECMNTEFMSSAKWVKLLREIGAIISPDAERRPPSGAMELAEADIVFQKVLHDCDFGGKRLTYELFCKGLYLVGRIVRPDLDSEAAFSELLSRVIALAPEDNTKHDEKDLMLDANVLLVLDHYKPALHDLFTTFCSRNLDNPTDANRGAGTLRIRERTAWKHTRDTNLSMMMTGMGSTMHRGTGMGSIAGPGGGASSKPNHAGYKVEENPNAIADSRPTPLPVACEADLPFRGARSASPPSTKSEADAGGGYAERRVTPPLTPRRQKEPLLPVIDDTDSEQYPQQQTQTKFTSPRHFSPRASSPGAASESSPVAQGRVGHMLIDGGCPGLASERTCYSTIGPSASQAGSSVSGRTDPFLYTNGVPTIANRRRHMSIDQLVSMCKALKILPDLLTRFDIVQVFKRAQNAGSASNHGSSVHGFLTKETFVDAAGQLAIEAYSKSPYSEEYPEAHEKIHAFFHSILPSNSREVHDRFLYGCSGRGRD
mmetsp:Transcript_47103/g.131400  ORF Transcript_47103/g.131400 Transcript_47103/m.131400 type:complete len:608 (-) Transcript_47103:158-1981(-)